MPVTSNLTAVSGMVAIGDGAGGEMYYEMHGDGAPLLMIAGLASDSQSWLPVIPILSQRRGLIVYDNRCTGRTRDDGGPVIIDHMVGDALSLLDHLGLERVAVVGHSMGGLISLKLAADHPERVSALVLAGTPGTFSARNRLLLSQWAELRGAGMSERQWFLTLFYWLFSQGFFNDGDVLESALQGALHYPFRQSANDFRRQVSAISSFDDEGVFDRVRQRVSVVAGNEDILFPVSDCRLLADRIPEAQFVVIPGAAHSIHSEKPTEFAEVVLSFLKDEVG